MRFKSFYEESMAIPPGMSSIPHIHDLNLPGLERFVKNKDYESTEKVDGSNVSIGIINDKAYAKSKKGKPVTDPKEFYDMAIEGGLDVMNVFGTAVEMLDDNDFVEWQNQMLKEKGTDLRKYADTINGLIILAEIFNSPQVNALEYSAEKIGDRALVVFGIKINDGTPKGVEITTKGAGKSIMNDFVKTFNKKNGFNIYLRHDTDINIDKKSLSDIEKYINDNRGVLTTRKRDETSITQKKNAKAELAQLVADFKRGILDQIENRESFLGNAGVEGVILRGLTNGAITKIVDIDDFTELNTRNWAGRESMKKERGDLYKELISNVAKSADVLIMKDKQEEKLRSGLESLSKTKFDSQEELVRVLYDDAKEEVVLDSSGPVEMINLVRDYISNLEQSKGDLDQHNMDSKNYNDTVKMIDREIEYSNELIDIISTTKDLDNKYVTIFGYLLGRPRLDDLTAKFVK